MRGIVLILSLMYLNSLLDRLDRVDMESFGRTFFVILWMILLIYAMWVTPASSHELYPSECCSGRDCRPVPCSELVYDPVRRQTIYLPTQTPSASTPRVSPDGNCHVCIVSGASQAVCVFLPGMS